DRRFGADFDASFARGIGDGIRNGACAAAAETPGTERAVDFAHVVMEEDIRGSGRANTKERPDDAGGGHSCFENVSLEPLVEKIGRAHGHELDEGIALV